MAEQSFPLERVKEIKDHPAAFRLLEQVPLIKPEVCGRMPCSLAQPEPDEELRSFVVLDQETTGLDPLKDQVIELGMVRGLYSAGRGVITEISAVYDGFCDPQCALSALITKLTGITDQMVCRRRLDNNQIAQLLADDPLIIAHNAAFDRPFFEKCFPQYKDLRWACTMRDIAWNDLGCHNRSLEYLLLKHGWFYPAHRAATDCMALTWLLYVQPEAMRMLLKSAAVL